MLQPEARESVVVGRRVSYARPQMAHAPYVFVLGGHKTSTSTVNALLNTSRRACVLYEADLAASTMTKYGHRLVEALPAVRSIMGVHDHWCDPYRALPAVLADAEASYDVVGDKIVTLDPARLDVPGDVRLIVTGRDVATWCGKRQIMQTYRTDLDVVPAARDLLRFWIAAGECNNTLRVRLEELIADAPAFVDRLRAFTGMTDIGLDPAWWTEVGNWNGDPMKQRVLRWPEGHPSSRREPAMLDTTATPNTHPFWEVIAQLEAPGMTLDQARPLLDALCQFSPLPLHDAYDALESTSAIRELEPVRLQRSSLSPSGSSPSGTV